MTHDLIKTVIDSLGSTLTEVYINELREGTFFAKLMLDGFETEIDSRPSDAIALAVRYGAPIYIQDSILTDAGFLPEGENDDDEGIEMPETPSVPEEKPQRRKRSPPSKCCNTSWTRRFRRKTTSAPPNCAMN